MRRREVLAFVSLLATAACSSAPVEESSSNALASGGKSTLPVETELPPALPPTPTPSPTQPPTGPAPSSCIATDAPSVAPRPVEPVMPEAACTSEELWRASAVFADWMSSPNASQPITFLGDVSYDCDSCLGASVVSPNDGGLHDLACIAEVSGSSCAADVSKQIACSEAWCAKCLSDPVERDRCADDTIAKGVCQRVDPECKTSVTSGPASACRLQSGGGTVIDDLQAQFAFIGKTLCGAGI